MRTGSSSVDSCCLARTQLMRNMLLFKFSKPHFSSLYRRYLFVQDTSMFSLAGRAIRCGDALFCQCLTAKLYVCPWLPVGAPTSCLIAQRCILRTSAHAALLTDYISGWIPRVHINGIL